MDPLRLGMLAYPDCFASEVFGITDLLTMANHVAAARGAATTSTETTLVSPRRRVAVSGGVTVGVRPLRDVDVLVVPGFACRSGADVDAALGRLAAELAAIRSHAAAGGAVVSICVGAFLLGGAGLLDGRSATTSWRFAELLAERHPATTVRPDELVVTDRGVTTTAAFSAMYDFALGLVRDRDGPAVARRTARLALVDDARSTQMPYVDADLLPAGGPGFSAAVRRRLDRDLAARYDLQDLAGTFHVSARTLLRRFREETGQTPLGYLQARRVRRARHLLESTDRTVADIAADVGYRDPGTFAALFARHTGRRPGEFRATFRRG